MKFKLITVRHGQTLGNAASVLQGHDDSPLTPLGIASSAKTGNALREIQFNQVYCSDLGRARETLQCMGMYKGCKLDKRLRERHWGPWQGRNWKEYQRASADTGGKSLAGVETDDAMTARWEKFLSELVDTLHTSSLPHPAILLVTHGGMVRVIGRYLTALSPNPINVDQMSFPNNCISEFDVIVGEGGIVTGCEVVRLLDAEHLKRPFMRPKE